MFFISLFVLKHGQQWKSIAKLLKLSSCTMKLLVIWFLILLSPTISEKYVTRTEERWSMSNLKSEDKCFKKINYA